VSLSINKGGSPEPTAGGSRRAENYPDIQLMFFLGHALANQKGCPCLNVEALSPLSLTAGCAAERMPRQSAVERRGAVCTTWAMAEGKKKRATLGPGLFAPDLQETPDSAFEAARALKKPDLLVGTTQVASLFDSTDSDKDGKINFEGMEELVSGLGHEMSKSDLTSAFRSLDSAGVGFVRCCVNH
jgi:hypothetical protein